MTQSLLFGKEEEKVLDDFPNETTKICCWNVNGIRAVIGRKQLQDFITKYDPDILCLNETKISEDNILKFGIRKVIPKEYKLYWN